MVIQLVSRTELLLPNHNKISFSFHLFNNKSEKSTIFIEISLNDLCFQFFENEGRAKIVAERREKKRAISERFNINSMSLILWRTSQHKILHHLYAFIKVTASGEGWKSKAECKIRLWLFWRALSKMDVSQKIIRLFGRKYSTVYLFIFINI